MPPLQALLALHAFWLVVLVPLVVMTVRCGTPWLLEVIGLGLAAIGVASVAYLIYADVYCWCQAFHALRAYWLQRSLFVLFTEADFPRIHLLLAGGVFLSAAIWKKRCHRDRQVGADLTSHDGHSGVSTQRT